MKLYYNPLSPNARKVLVTAKLAGVELEHNVLDFRKGEHKAPEFLAINPNGKVPALVDGELKLWESNAIMQYLADKGGSDLWPSDAAGRADVSRWQCWQLAHWGQCCGELVYERVLKQMRGQQADEAKVADALERFNQYAPILNAALEGRNWLVGDKLSLADIACAAPLTYAGPAQLPVDGHTHITAWLGRLDKNEAWTSTAPKLG